MLFNSFTFLFLFLPATLAGALIAERFGRQQLAWWLISTSVVFYGAWNPQFLWVVAVSIFANYALALVMTRSEKHRKLWLVLGIAGNLGALFYFKYTNFLSDTLGSLGLDTGWARIVLPLGISFFTFQKIAFLVDTYRGREAPPAFGRYALFILFFPQLIAGPIVHHREFIPQIDRARADRLADIGEGLALFAAGLLKKVYIADALAIPSSLVFDTAAAGVAPGLGDAWLAALCYTGQIYFDFSAYSDMAVGLGRMFGFDLPINFASPYKASSIVDFWRRWHITLSRFLRDYLYIPLGGSRGSVARWRFNLFATMTLGGIWHGAGWTFLLWGMLHGAFLLVAHGFRRTRLAARLEGRRWWTVAAQTVTLLCVIAAWVPFRAADLGTTLRLWGGMLGLSAAPARFAIAGDEVLPMLAVAAAIALFAPNAYELLRSARLGLASPGYPATVIAPAPARFIWSPLHAAAIGLMLAAVVLKLNDISEFIYFQF